VSDAEPEADEHDEPEEVKEQESDDGQPDLSESETADLGGLDLDADDLAPDDDEDDGDESEGTESAEPASQPEPMGAGGNGQWGEMYVSLLTQTTNTIIDKHGDGDQIDEDHFRTVDLDHHFDRVMEKYSGGSEMPPEQALVVGTLIAVGGPIAVHTDLPQQLRQEVNDA